MRKACPGGENRRLPIKPFPTLRPFHGRPDVLETGRQPRRAARVRQHADPPENLALVAFRCPNRFIRQKGLCCPNHSAKFSLKIWHHFPRSDPSVRCPRAFPGLFLVVLPFCRSFRSCCFKGGVAK